MKWFEDIFTKSKLMIISGIVAVLANLVNAIISIINYPVTTVPYLIIAIIPALILYCYWKGETSCQKALIGAILGIMVYSNWVIMSGTYGTGDRIYELFQFVLAILFTVMFINHLLLQIDHKGDEQIVFVSQILLIIAIIWQIAGTIVSIAIGAAFYDTLTSLAFLATITMITCIESRIQKYKAKRSEGRKAGTWTEEERQKYKKIFKF